MSVLKDAVLVWYSLLVMLALRYLLQQHRVIDCGERYCASVGNNQAGHDNSYAEGFMPSWIANEEAQDKTRCLCCKVVGRGCCTSYVYLATFHLVISVAVVFLKHKTFNSSKHLWIYIILIIAAIINTIFLTQLVRRDTHPNPVVEPVKKEGLLWKIFSLPFRFIWNTLASVLTVVFYKILKGLLGCFTCYESARTSVMFLCSPDRNTMLSLNVMIEYAISALSWTYVASAVANIYSLMKSLAKEQRALLENANNNEAKDEQEEKNECRLCREILAAKRRMKMRDVSDSEDSDHDSFVLGWRL